MERGRGRTEGEAERGEQLGGLLAKLVGDHGQSGAAAELGGRYAAPWQPGS